MNQPTPDQPAVESSSSEKQSHPSGIAALRNAVCLGIVGAVAAVIASFAIQQTGIVFRLPDDLLELTAGKIPNTEEQQKIGAGLVILNYKQYSLWMSIAGATIGGLFGLTLGMMRRSGKALIVGTLGGVILGGALSGCGGFVGNYVGENIVTSVRLAKLQVPEQYSMMLHGSIWLLAGLGIGLGVGLGATKNKCQSALGSMFIGGIAGAAGGALYPFVTGALMPLVDASMTIPQEHVNRIVWIGIPSLLMGLVLGRKG